MSGPPRHLLVYRWVMVVAVVLGLALAGVLTPWPEVGLVLDPFVDGLRRSVWT